MNTITTCRSRILTGCVVVALGCLTTVRAAPDSTRPVALQRLQPRFSATPGFYEAYLAPRMSARLGGEHAVAPARFANSTSNPWTSDPVGEQRVEKRAIRAIKGVLRRFAIEQIGIDQRSRSTMGGSGRGGTEPADGSRRMRVQFGFSSLAPRADLLIPVAAGRVLVSADARGRIRTEFEGTSSKLRVGADFDVPERTATAGLSWRF